MSKELNYYFNGTAFNKLVYDAGYDNIKDFAERSGITISYKTIKRACNGGQCTKRTYYAIANKLAEMFGWIDPRVSLKTAFTSKPKYVENENSQTNNKKLENCIVYLSDGREALVQGKSIYWSWFDGEKTICFYDEDGCDDGDLKIAEFNKACVIGIVRIIEE